jgi:uncharacterized CHY-type Zn-finger protein
MHLHRSIERAEMDFLEDEFLAEANLHRQRISLPIPELFAQVDVVDLAKDERECHVCMEEYVSRNEKDREEEKPCKLSCGHVLGRVCAEKAFAELGMKCPFCRTVFNPRNYVVEPVEVASPWWMRHLRLPIEM